jgi:hypothetical protein
LLPSVRDGMSAHRQCVARLTRHTTQPSRLDNLGRACRSRGQTAFLVVREVDR